MSAFIVAPIPVPAAPPTPDAVTVFTRESADAYEAIRIPAIVQSKGGTLLAFAEGRVLDSDHGENDILLRRSNDDGATWSDTQVVAESGKDSLNDPCALALRDPDRIFLVYHRYPQGYHGRAMEHTKRAEPGYDGPANGQSFLTISDDAGATWSVPRDITRELREPDVIAVGSPGNFIQIQQGPRAGRIVLPLYENMPLGEGDKLHNLRSAFSDDLGETWTLGARISYENITGWGTEAQIAECAEGGLLMSARLQDGGAERILSESHDGGQTWSPAHLESALQTPPCMSSIVSRVNSGGEGATLFHTLPNTTDERKNGTLFRSTDCGKTWKHDQVIYPGGFAYSALVILNDGRLGCLYERDDYKTISYTVRNHRD